MQEGLSITVTKRLQLHRVLLSVIRHRMESESLMPCNAHDVAFTQRVLSAKGQVLINKFPNGGGGEWFPIISANLQTSVPFVDLTMAYY